MRTEEKFYFLDCFPRSVRSSKQILFSKTHFKAKKYFFEGDVKLQNTHLPDTL